MVAISSEGTILLTKGMGFPHPGRYLRSSEALSWYYTILLVRYSVKDLVVLSHIIRPYRDLQNRLTYCHDVLMLLLCVYCFSPIHSSAWPFLKYLLTPHNEMVWLSSLIAFINVFSCTIIFPSDNSLSSLLPYFCSIQSSSCLGYSHQR